MMSVREFQRLGCDGEGSVPQSVVLCLSDEGEKVGVSRAG